MINWWFIAAAGLAWLAAGIHILVGGRYVVRPLLAATDITPASRWLNYFCWHMVSILLCATGLVFVRASASVGARDLAAVFTSLAMAFAVLCLAVALRGGLRPWRVPPLILFILIGSSGLIGLFAVPKGLPG